ncbi:MAG: T9SS type A sorting domain-containing protein [Ginsengibacter sp.]
MKYSFQIHPSVALVIIISFILTQNIKAQIITTVAGNGTGTYNGDNIPALQAQFLPEAIAVDKFGNIYISDLDDSRVRKIDNNGIITTVAGTGVRNFSGDGGPAINAELNYNWGIALDSALNLFIVDDGESRVRKVTNDGIINTIAGIDVVNGGGYNGDNILAINARFDHPSYVALDDTGNIYVSDQGARIRKIDTNGIITTIAGTGVYGYSGDGGLAVNAEIGPPYGIALDKKGNIYFVDADTSVIRKIDKNGFISTFAGKGHAGYNGDGGPASAASLNNPATLAVAMDGTIYVADAGNHAIRKVDTLGIITTIIGDGTPGFSGDGGLAKNAKLYFPAGVAFDNAGNLFIADYGNARIRKVTFAALPITLTEFSAAWHNEKVALTWKAFTDNNSAYFNVQRSDNGYNFTMIGKVAALGGNGIANQYNFIDLPALNLPGNSLYYRLQSVDKNGSSIYSKTISVRLKYFSSFTIFPNPAKEVLNAELLSSKEGQSTIKIINVEGKIIKQLMVQTHKGYNHLQINITDLQAGSYSIRVNGIITQYKQFIKL